MFRLAIVSRLASLQLFFLLGAGLISVCGIHVSWVLILIPLWLLLGLAFVFWNIFAAILKAFT